MNATAYPLTLPASLQKAAKRLTGKDGVSLDHWIAMAVARKVGAVETAGSLRAGHGRPEPDDPRAVLDKVPDAPTVPGDELPGDL